MTTMRLYVDRRFITDFYLEQLKEHFPDIDLLPESDKTKAETLMVMPSFFRRFPIDHFPDLRWVQLLSAGYDGVPLETLRERHILLTNARDVYSIQIAEDVFSKILSFNRHVTTYHEQMKKGSWERHDVFHEIHGSTVGLIGAGSIATEIAKRMKAFGAHTIGFRRKAESVPHIDRIVTDSYGLDEIYRTSDYLILSIPLNSETRHMISKDVFERMKNSALIINVARGDIIVQDDLVDALDKGSIRGALLDVTSPEPLPKNHPLWHMKQVFITPHTASESPYAYDRIYRMVHRNLTNHLSGKKPDFIVNG